MKRASTILFILMFPLSLPAMDRLSDTDLSGVSSRGSLSGQYYLIEGTPDPGILSVYIHEEGGIVDLTTNVSPSSGLWGTEMSTRGIRNLRFYPDTLDNETARVSDVDVPFTMTRISFPNGLRSVEECPHSVEVWLGGLKDSRNAGKMCDFYFNGVRSSTLPNSSVDISVH